MLLTFFYDGRKLSALAFVVEIWMRKREKNDRNIKFNGNTHFSSKVRNILHAAFFQTKKTKKSLKNLHVVSASAWKIRCLCTFSSLSCEHCWRAHMVSFIVVFRNYVLTLSFSDKDIMLLLLLPPSSLSSSYFTVAPCVLYCAMFSVCKCDHLRWFQRPSQVRFINHYFLNISTGYTTAKKWEKGTRTLFVIFIHNFIEFHRNRKIVDSVKIKKIDANNANFVIVMSKSRSMSLFIDVQLWIWQLFFLHFFFENSFRTGNEFGIKSVHIGMEFWVNVVRLSSLFFADFTFCLLVVLFPLLLGWGYKNEYK